MGKRPGQDARLGLVNPPAWCLLRSVMLSAQGRQVALASPATEVTRLHQTSSLELTKAGAYLVSSKGWSPDSTASGPSRCSSRVDRSSMIRAAVSSTDFPAPSAMVQPVNSLTV